MRAVQIWRSEDVQFHSDTRFAVALQMIPVSVVACLCHLTLAEWHLGEIASCHATIEEAISMAKKLNDVNALAIALGWAATLAECERNPRRSALGRAPGNVLIKRSSWASTPSLRRR
jgi:hypothetical protein